MPAVLELRLTGGSANSNPNASLGGVSSVNQISGTALNNIFDDISSQEATDGRIEYRALDLYNSGDATAQNIIIFISSETLSAYSQLDIGKVTSPVDDTETIANETTAPVGAGITFSHPLFGSGLSLPNIPSGSYCRLWIKRTVSSSAPNYAGDSANIKWEYA